MKRFLPGLWALLFVASVAFAGPTRYTRGTGLFGNVQATGSILAGTTVTATTAVVATTTVTGKHIHRSAGTQTVPDGTTTLVVAAGVGCIPVAGTGGATTLGGTPLITAGATVGQELILIGTSDTNTVLVPDSGNVNTTGTITLGIHDTLRLVWDGTQWCETSTSNN